jgi:hypothetical protein
MLLATALQLTGRVSCGTERCRMGVVSNERIWGPAEGRPQLYMATRETHEQMATEIVERSRREPNFERMRAAVALPGTKAVHHLTGATLGEERRGWTDRCPVFAEVPASA